MEILTFSGSGYEIGLAYGKHFAKQILKSFQTLLPQEFLSSITQNEDYLKWREKRMELTAALDPELFDEMKGLADGCGLSYEDILNLNFRAWQFELYRGNQAADCCSSLIVRLKDGTDCIVGALDDKPSLFYDAPIRIIPNKGYSFVAPPFLGTVWANRGMNSKGLSIGISSQILDGLQAKENFLQQDIAIRLILQNCRTVKEVKDFCYQHPFTLNVVAADALGESWCAQCTLAGVYELEPEEPRALTNHVIRDSWMLDLHRKGVKAFYESPTTRCRRGYALELIKLYDRKLTLQELLTILEKRDDAFLGSICNKTTICMTASCPQKDSNTIYLFDPLRNQGFEPFPVETVEKYSGE